MPLDETLLARVRAGHHPTPAEVQSALVREGVEERAETARLLASELLRLGEVDRALQLLELAWYLGSRSLELLRPLLALLGRAGRPRDALDRAREGALAALEHDDVGRAIECLSLGFDLGFANHLPPQDPVLLGLLQKALRPYALKPRPLRPGGRVRVGYVFWGETAAMGALPWVFLRIAEHQDRSRFEPVFFSEFGAQRFTEPRARRVVEQVRALGAELVTNPRDVPGLPGDLEHMERALGLVEAIVKSEVDVLLFQSQAPVFLVAALLRPAPLVLGFDHGDPTVYASPALDACITPFERWSLEHTCRSILIEQRRGAFLPNRPPEVAPLTRAALGIPEDALVVMTAGYPSKFAPTLHRIDEYLGMVAEVLERHPRAFWVVVGVTAAELAHCAALSRPGVASRVRALGLTDGLASVFPVADVYLDTFPISGGLCVYEAMRAALPSVTYRFHFAGLFDKERAYSVVGDCVDGTELVTEEPDVPHLRARLERLLADPGYRAQLGRAGREAMETYSDAPGFTRECERILDRLLAERRSAP